jgi:hypothetical protein
LVDILGVEHDLLHVPLGLLLFSLMALILWRRADRLTWAFFGLVLLQLMNEALDSVQWVSWTGRIPWSEAARDTAVTLAAPLAVVLASLLTRCFKARRVPVKPRSDPRRATRGLSGQPVTPTDGDVA